MTKAAFQPHRVSVIKPLHDAVIVSDMVFDSRITTSGVIILNDDTKSAGIRPRWCKVYAVGPEQADVKVGEWIMVAHGRWTRGIKIEDDTGPVTIRRVDNKDILLVSDTPRQDETMGDKVY